MIVDVYILDDETKEKDLVVESVMRALMNHDIRFHIRRRETKYGQRVSVKVPFEADRKYKRVL